MSTTIHSERFASWSAYVDRAVSGETSFPAADRSSRRHDWGGSWAGTETFAEAVDLARRGWREGAELIAPMFAALTAKVESKILVQTPAYAPVGPGTLDMGRYLMGHPAPYMVWEDSYESDDSPSGRIVHIVLNMTTSANIDKRVMFRKGAAVAALVDVLERAGRRVELDAAICESRQGMGARASVTVRLKGASDALEIEQLAFTCAHAAAFRRIGFGVMECWPDDVRARLGVYHGGNYGTPTELPEAERGDIYIGRSYDGGTRQWATEDAAAAWVVAQLAVQGVEVTD